MTDTRTPARADEPTPAPPQGVRTGATRAPARPRSRRRRVRLLATFAVLGVLALLAGVAASLALSARQSGKPLLGPDEVPAEYRGLVQQAAARCPAVPVKVFAAQLATESGWNPAATSPAGAQGIAQFMPAVWRQFGIDGDGDGVKDVWNPADAIPSAARLNCINRDLVKGVAGDRLSNTLAAYNAGHSAVRKYGGVPPFPETTAYVTRILDRARTIQF